MVGQQLSLLAISNHLHQEVKPDPSLQKLAAARASGKPFLVDLAAMSLICLGMSILTVYTFVILYGALTTSELQFMLMFIQVLGRNIAVHASPYLLPGCVIHSLLLIQLANRLGYAGQVWGLVVLGGSLGGILAGLMTFMAFLSTTHVETESMRVLVILAALGMLAGGGSGWLLCLRQRTQVRQAVRGTI